MKQADFRGCSFLTIHTFHFPTPGIHDDEYCDIFVKYCRKNIDSIVINEKKAMYLLMQRAKDDKSSFLNNLGYDVNSSDKLLLDIYNNTQINSLTFSRNEKMCLKCVAKTILNGKIVTSVWKLKNSLEIRFITLIPGGEKRWK